MIPFFLLAAALPALNLQSSRTQLENGLTVIVSPDHAVPGVAVEVGYRVGSQDEEQGRSGFAHLFEHLMFMGSRNVPYPRFDTIMEAYGGQNNASTSHDWTRYHEVGPSNLLETFLWMEADRMATLGAAMTQEKLDLQRQVVLNERRQSYENRPYGLAGLTLQQTLFPEGHPYHFPTIGSAKDIEEAKLDDVRRFFARYYVPSNASLVVVGDVEPAETLALARKYFGFIPAGRPNERSALPPVRLAQPRRVALEDRVELPKIILAWPSPAAFTESDADCDLLAVVLGAGRASRLYRRLVYDRQIAVEVSASQESLQRQSVFTIDALIRPGRTADETIAAIDEELARVREEGPGEEELSSARTRLFADTARSLEGLVARALRIETYQDGLGNPNGLRRDLDRYVSATPQRVRETARQVLGPGRVAVEVKPRGQEPLPRASRGGGR